MVIKEVQQLIGNILKAEVKIPVMLVGETGIGKSQSLRELAVALREKAKERVGFIDLRLATQEVTDLIGIPRTICVDTQLKITLSPEVINNILVKQLGEKYLRLLELEKNTDKDNLEQVHQLQKELKEVGGRYRFKTFWSEPVWFPEEGTTGILALEEVNRAPEDVRQAIFQLLTEWKLHTHSLPTSWAIVALINPDNGAYHVNQLGPAFERRFLQIRVTPPDQTDWCVWAKKNKVDDRVIRFIAQFPKMLGKEEDITIKAFPTRAGNDMLSKLLIHDIIPAKCLHEVATGILGIEAATVFVQSLKRNFEKPITAAQIFSDYEKVREDHKKLIEGKRNDLLYVTMVDIIASCEIDKLSKSDLKGLHSYLTDCSPETLTTIVLRLSEKILQSLSNFEDLANKVLEIKKSISDI